MNLELQLVDARSTHQEAIPKALAALAIAQLQQPPAECGAILDIVGAPT